MSKPEAYRLGDVDLTLSSSVDAEGRGSVSLTEGDAEARALDVEVLNAAPGRLTLRLGGRTHRARVVKRGDDLWVAVGGESYRLQVARRQRGGSDAETGRIEAPMPGALLEVLVEDGQAVDEGQDLVVVEAMKMEHRMKAPFAGVVRGLTATAGDRVEPGVPILVLEASADA